MSTINLTPHVDQRPPVPDPRPFIGARLLEDSLAAAAAAVANHGDRWAYSALDTYGFGANGEVFVAGHEDWHVTCDTEGLSPAVDEPTGAHIARQDPARTLAYAELVRAVLAANPPTFTIRPDCGVGDLSYDDGDVTVRVPWSETPVTIPSAQFIAECTVPADPPAVLLAAASIWSDHPDFDQAWAVG